MRACACPVFHSVHTRHVSLAAARCAATPYGDSMTLAEHIFSQSAPGEVSRAYFRMQCTPVSTVCPDACPDMSRHVQTHMSRHGTHHLQPGGVHIFACLGSFRNFAPKHCIFSHTIPVCATRERDRFDLSLGAGVCARPAPRHKMCAAKPNMCERPYRIYTRARQLIANTDRPRRHYRPERPQRDRYVCRARTRTAHGHKSLPSLGQGGQG